MAGSTLHHFFPVKSALQYPLHQLRAPRDAQRQQNRQALPASHTMAHTFQEIAP